MKRVRKNQVNRCFGICPKKPKNGDKPKPPPLTEQQKEEKIKRILIEAAEKKKRKRAEKEISSLLREYKSRYSVLKLLPLIKWKYPWLLEAAVKKVEGQKNRSKLSLDEIVEFEELKISLKKEKSSSP